MDRDRRHHILDGALAAAVAAMAVVEVAVPLSTVMGAGSTPAALVAAGTACGALALRRRYPLLAMAGVTLPWAVLGLLLPLPVLFWGGLVPMVLANFSLVRHGTSRQALVGLGVAVAGTVVWDVGSGMAERPGELWFHWLALIVAWACGLSLRRTEVVARAAEQRAAHLEATGREQTLVAIAEERGRIARELHDVVAHAVTAMVVQAGAAGQVVDDDPAQVRESLDQIRSTGSQALAQMRRVVAFLRDGAEDGLLAPAPGIEDVPTLVEQSGGASTRVRLTVEGTARPLPAGAGLAAYRIVQESLTNAHRHAEASDVVVTIRYGTADLTITVVDNGRGHAGTHARRGAPAAGVGVGVGVGHGLLGMRERVAMYGGQLRVGSAPGAVHTVRATIPLEAAR